MTIASLITHNKAGLWLVAYDAHFSYLTTCRSFAFYDAPLDYVAVG